MSNYNILYNIATDVISKIKAYNYLTGEKEFVISVPIFYSNKLYYQTIYKINNHYDKMQPDTTNLISRHNDIYKYIFGLISPNKLLNNRDMVNIHKQCFATITEIGKYNWFDMCINTRQIKCVIEHNNDIMIKDDIVYVPVIQHREHFNNLDWWLQ